MNSGLWVCWLWICDRHITRNACSKSIGYSIAWITEYTFTHLFRNEVSIVFSNYGAHFRHWCLKSEIILYIWISRAVYFTLTTKHNTGLMSTVLERTNSISLNRWCDMDVQRLTNNRHRIHANVAFPSMSNDVRRLNKRRISINV